MVCVFCLPSLIQPSTILETFKEYDDVTPRGLVTQGANDFFCEVVVIQSLLGFATSYR